MPDLGTLEEFLAGARADDALDAAATELAARLTRLAPGVRLARRLITAGG